MIYKFEYSNEIERANIIEGNKALFLIEDSIKHSGNELTFSNTQAIESQIQEVKNNTDLIILKQEGIL